MPHQQESTYLNARRAQRLEDGQEPEEVLAPEPPDPTEMVSPYLAQRRAEREDLEGVTVTGGGVVQPAVPVPARSTGEAFDRLRVDPPELSAAQLASTGPSSSPLVQATQEGPAQGGAAFDASLFLPGVGGALDIASMATREREGLIEDFKTNPLRTGLLVGVRLGVDALDLFPGIAIARQASKVGIKAALGGGRVARTALSPAATRRLTQEALETGSSVVQAVEKGGKVVRIEGVGEDLAGLAPGGEAKRWHILKKNDLGEKGWHADFAGPQGRTGTAAVRRKSRRVWQSTVSLGPEKVIVGEFRTLREARQAISEMGTDPLRQADALLTAAKVEAGGSITPATRNGAVRAKAARVGANRSKDPIVQEMAPTDSVIAKVGAVYEPAIARRGLLSRFRSVEAVAEEATGVARTGLQDFKIESAAYFDDLFEASTGTGWLTKKSGVTVVKNKALDKEIFDVVNGDIPLELASPKARTVVERIQGDYVQRGVEIKQTPGFEGMPLRTNYITWLRGTDEGTELLKSQFQASQLEQTLGRNVAFRFRFGRKGDAPELRSAWESVRAYHTAAIRAKHAQRALKTVDGMLDEAVAAGNQDLAWGIGQVKAILTGQGHDPWLMDGAAIASAMRFLSGGRASPTSDDVVFTVARGMSNLYRGLMSLRPGIAFDQFSQFPNLAADVGGPRAARGIGDIVLGAATPEGLKAGARNLATPATATGAAISGGLGFVVAGPVGAAVAAAIVPAARFAKGAVASQFSPDILERMGASATNRMFRGSEFIRPHTRFVRHLDAAGFSEIEAAEMILRGASTRAGLDAAISTQGLTGRAAMDFAIDVNNKNQFIYDQFSRNPFFRHSVIGAIAAPLSSFAPKQGRLIMRLMLEGGSDGASPGHAMARYLFYNGLLTQAYRQSTKALLGEELVPRAAQEKVVPAFLNESVDSPSGFQSVSSFSAAPGVDVLGAFKTAMESDGEFNVFIDQFLKNFFPIGLGINDAFRARQRIDQQMIRRQEGVRPAIQSEGAGVLLGRAGQSRGGQVRETTTAREVMRMFSFVSPEEIESRDLERFAGQNLRDMNKEASGFLVEAEAAMRARNPQALARALNTPAGRRAQASGKSKKTALENAQRVTLLRNYANLPKAYRLVIERTAQGRDVTVKKLADKLQIPPNKLAKWVIIYGMLEKSHPKHLERLRNLRENIRETVRQ